MLTPRSDETYFGEQSYVMIWLKSPAGAFQIETSSSEQQQEKTASQPSATAQQPEQPAQQPRQLPPPTASPCWHPLPTWHANFRPDGWPQRVPDATLAPRAQPAPADAGCSCRAGAAGSWRPVSAQPAPADAKCCLGAPGPVGACPTGASGSWRPMPSWRPRRPLTGMACRQRLPLGAAPCQMYMLETGVGQ